MVASYNPSLLYMFKAHINLMMVISHVAACKYLTGYVGKGQFGDRTAFNVMNEENTNGHVDEIQNFLSARVYGGSEAFCDIYGIEPRSMYPPVENLKVHEENANWISFSANLELTGTAALNTRMPSQLEAFFTANATNAIGLHGKPARELL